MVTKISEQEVTKAVDDLFLLHIERHALSRAPTPKLVSLDFYRAIVDECHMRIEALVDEVGDEHDDD